MQLACLMYVKRSGLWGRSCRVYFRRYYNEIIQLDYFAPLSKSLHISLDFGLLPFECAHLNGGKYFFAPFPSLSLHNTISCNLMKRTDTIIAKFVEAYRHWATC